MMFVVHVSLYVRSILDNPLDVNITFHAKAGG